MDEKIVIDPRGSSFRLPVSAVMKRAEFERRLRHWCDGQFRAACNDDERVLRAAAVMKVALTKGDAPLDALRITIAAFVQDVIESPPDQSN